MRVKKIIIFKASMYLKVGSPYFKEIQLEPNLTNVAVHPVNHEAAHGLRHARVHKVRPVLIGRAGALVLEQAAHTES
jgi:hypothetical protein